jgi:IS30 family transposase
MNKIHHLTLQDRQTIEAAIARGETLAEMGRLLGKDPAGISREIKRHREFKARNTFNTDFLCENRRQCKKRCLRPCPQVKAPTCKRRDSSPGACNGCEKKQCRMDKYYYVAKRADANYRETLVSSREGINLTSEERDAIGVIIAPLLNQGQSVYQVLSAHPELGLSERSLYRHIEYGVFKNWDVDHFSLKEKVNRKRFKEKYKKRKEPANYNGRRYADYLAFRELTPEYHVVEMDTVYNHPSGPYLQTFLFPSNQFMLGRLHQDKTSASMASTLDLFQDQLGLELFRKLFPILLADRGSEFEMFLLFEKDQDHNDRSRIFYCDPMQSSQKPHVENGHNYVRDIIPNGKPMIQLTREDISLMFSHINSTPRRSLKGKTPFEVFSFFHGADTAALLGVQEIPRDDVVLHPSLIFHHK